MTQTTEPMITTGFNHECIDGDEYYYKYLATQQYIQLWRPAPYYYIAININTFSIFSYTEGDLQTEKHNSLKSFMTALTTLKKYWVDYLKDKADPMLCCSGEYFGFLSFHSINLYPPKCPTCERISLPTNEQTSFLPFSFKNLNS